MIKVASYCRVSTDRDDQANSFESQQRYFKEYIDRQPDWELYQVYANKRTTGVSTKKRAAFNRILLTLIGENSSSSLPRRLAVSPETSWIPSPIPES